ncbi:hypothetical protein PG995_007814 [Apiospora arundinis]
MGQSSLGGWEDEEGRKDDGEDCQNCDFGITVKRKPQEILIHYSTIASGNQVVKDTALRDRLSKDLGGILYIEIEAAGLPNSFPYIVIHGICDYTDSHKNKTWQEHAAAIAAVFTKEILGYVQPKEVLSERIVQEQIGKKIDIIADSFKQVHYTTQEYFGKRQSVWFPDVQLRIAEVCTTYLSFRIFESGPTESVEDLISRFKNNPLYIYAATYWVYHASQGSSFDHVTSFLKRQKALDASIQALRHFNHHALLPKSNRKHRQKLTGLHLAACYGFVDTVRELLPAYNVNVKDSIDGEDGQTPLWWAAANGREEVAQLLLDSGANIEARDNDDRTPLWMAVLSRHTSVVELLIKRGADIEAREEDGRTPLWATAAADLEDMGELLIENGANIEARDNFSWTPLHQAASHGNKMVVNLLIQRGGRH